MTLALSQNFPDAKAALVCGATRGIGLALTQLLVEETQITRIVATYRETPSTALQRVQESFPQRVLLLKLDVTKEEQFPLLGRELETLNLSLDIVLYCAGVLHTTSMQPERRIEELQPSNLQLAYSVNAIGAVLLAKTVKSFLRKAPQPLFAAISAKVGSIADNHAGGWYAYRMSKAALNMAIKNIALEFRRSIPNAVVVALHPGTTETDLSEPFLEQARKKYTIHTATETAHNLLNTAAKALKQKQTGVFLSYDGTELPW